MPPADSDARAARAVEIFGALVASADADPYPLYAQLHELGDAATAEPGLVVAFSHAAVSEVQRDPAYRVIDAARMDEIWPRWRDHPSLLAHSLLMSNSPEHERMRGLVGGTFTPRRVAQLRPAVERIADRLIDGMAKHGAHGTPVDFMAEFAYQLPVTVICELLGVPEPDRAAFRPVARDLARGIDVTEDPALIGAADAAAVWLHEYFGKLAAQRTAEPRGDLVSALVQAAGPEGRLNEAELLANLTLLLFAGFETTTLLLGNGLRMILTRPDVEASLRAEAGSMAAFVAELLRYDSPVHAGTDRWRPEAGALYGVPVPAGSRVMALLAAANRDPRKFAEPDRFDPARSDGGSLVSFGAGPHYCLGATLARLEATVAFPLLLARLPRLASGGEPVRRGGIMLRGFDRLPVTVG
jgi:cytochrome P450